MKIAIMQPYFMPYIGYWQLMATVDMYLVYDDVNYIKGGWVSRNNILLNGQKHMFTITLNGASPNKLFNEITIKDDFKKFSRLIESAYRKAPYYVEISALLEKIYQYEDKSLGIFMLNSFQVVLDYLEIDTKLVLSSTVTKDNKLRGKDKVKHICHLLGADTYYNAIGGRELYDKEDFKADGIDLHFLQTDLVPYTQSTNKFVSGLSIIDVLMYNGKEDTKKLLNEYTLL
ncbi:MAG: hypothetical protein E7075_02710 [Bacteroidales bacterium]|nr:hypothetical protein [Bacteroidales bacterium]